MNRSEDAAARAYLARLERQARQSERASHEAQLVMAGTQEAYRWGRIDRRSGAFQPKPRSADAAIYESQELMHSRTRSETENNALAKKIGEALTDLVIGEQMQTLSDPIDAAVDLEQLVNSDEFEHILGYALEADQEFTDWFSDPEQFDVEGKHAGPDIQRMMFAENVAVGDSFLLRTFVRRPGRRIPLAYQIIEREQLDCAKDRPAGVNQNKIINGIELDGLNREVGFHVLDAHPYDDFAAANMHSKSRFVPADRMIHLCAFRRPSQSLGVTWLHAIGQTNFDRDKLVGSELQGAVKRALVALILKLKNRNRGSQGIGLDDGLPLEDKFGNQQIKLGSSSEAAVIGPDDAIELVESVSNGASFGDFIDTLDHDMAGGAGLSYYTLTGRYANTNFSSLRGALLAEDLHVRPIQGWFARRVAVPIRQQFNQVAAGLGLYKTLSASEFLRDIRRYNRVEALGAGRELLDPEAETNAALGRLRGGLTTLKIECARRGLHWIRVLRQASFENLVARKFGVRIDFSKGQGGQVDKSTRDATDKAQSQQTQRNRSR